MIEIDGSLASGSGTVIRDAVSYSILKRQALVVTNIRAKREKPGLRPQHLKAVEAAAEISNGRLGGAALAVWAEMDTGRRIGSDMAGARGRSAEAIGKTVARRLLEDLASGADVDRHLADQVIPFAALAGGKSGYIIPRMTEHIESRLWLAQEILGAGAKVTRREIGITGIAYTS